MIFSSLPAVPTGSLIGQWIRLIPGGVRGQACSASTQSVMTTSMVFKSFSSIFFDFWRLISILISFITALARGCKPAAISPALNGSIMPFPNSRANPSAIWLRHALPVQRNITLIIVYLPQQLRLSRKLTTFAFVSLTFRNTSSRFLSFCTASTDAFSITAVMSLEASGFAAPGQGVRLGLDGEIGLNGKLPLCTMGGLKARGHPVGATGMYQIVEAMLQLRGAAGKNQVKDATIGMTQNIGGSGSNVVTHIFERTV